MPYGNLTALGKDDSDTPHSEVIGWRNALPSIAILALVIVVFAVVLKQKAAYVESMREEEDRKYQTAQFDQARYYAGDGSFEMAAGALERVKNLHPAVREAVLTKARICRLANATGIGTFDEVREAAKGVTESDVRTLHILEEPPLDVLYTPAWRGRVGVLKYLMDAGWHPDGIRRDGAPLAAATSRGHVEAVQLLLARGARLDGKGLNGWTALMWAVVSDRPQILRLLLQRGADPTYRSAKGDTAISLAQRYGRSDMLKTLRSHAPRNLSRNR